MGQCREWHSCSASWTARRNEPEKTEWDGSVRPCHGRALRYQSIAVDVIQFENHQITPVGVLRRIQTLMILTTEPECVRVVRNLEQPGYRVTRRNLRSQRLDLNLPV